MPLTYRSVKGSKLTSAEADGNITNLDGRITNLEDNPPEPRSIDSTSAAGEVMTITYTDTTTDTVNLPKVEYHDRGAWAPLTLYAKYDTFPEEGTLYEVLYPHTSAATFDPGANDGMGHDYYRGIFSNPNSLDDLSDVETGTDGPRDGDALIWIQDLQLWMPGIPIIDGSRVTFNNSTDGTLTSAFVSDAIEEVEALVRFINALEVSFTPSTDSLLSADNASEAIEQVERRIRPPVISLGTSGSVSLNPDLSDVFTVIPAGAITLDATHSPQGAKISIVVTTSGTSSYVLTFGANFKTISTLATGTVSAKTFTITFVGDGVNLNEVARTTAM